MVVVDAITGYRSVPREEEEDLTRWEEEEENTMVMSNYHYHCHPLVMQRCSRGVGSGSSKYSV